MNDFHNEGLDADSELGLNSFNDSAAVGPLEPLTNQSGIVPEPVKVEESEDNSANLSNLSQDVNPYQSYSRPPEEINHVNNVSSLSGPPKRPFGHGEVGPIPTKSDIDTLSLIENYCDKHHQDEELICFDCRSRICTSCMIDEHKEHRTEDVEELIEQLEKDIIKDCNCSKELTQKLKKGTENIITKYQREIFRNHKNNSQMEEYGSKEFYMEDFRTFLMKRLEKEEDRESEMRERINALKRPRSKEQFINSIIEIKLAHSKLESDVSRLKVFILTLERIAKSLGGDYSETDLDLKNLKYYVNARELIANFKQFGNIKKVDCQDWESTSGKKTVRSAFISFVDPDAAQRALDNALKDPIIQSFYIHKTLFSIQFHQSQAIMHEFMSSQRVLKGQVEQMINPFKISVFHRHKTGNSADSLVPSQQLAIEILRSRFDDIMKMDVESQRQNLGELLFPLVKDITGENLALNITNMLIDLSVFELPEIIRTLEDETVFKERVREAMSKILFNEKLF